ncbi:hypothetical protein IFM89_013049 [Coptis chinensis]|uniref:Uncharacterized protein n=1 Tax=Coptis chinensis TaxID=261450 RepID=A0A835GXX7_9MAGN|nr:hypothetical protein IFM89_013049 [Coptis chinensis]
MSSLSLILLEKSDLEKREIYDQHGEDAINGGFPHGAGGHDPFDIFQNFFGGGDGSRRRRTEDVVHPLKVSLEDLYSGTSPAPSAKVIRDLNLVLQ